MTPLDQFAWALLAACCLIGLAALWNMEDEDE